MKTVAEPSLNRLAQAGLVSNEAGRILELPCGVLELPWLVEVSKEARRRAQQELKTNPDTLTPEERYSWFIASTEAEFKGFVHLLDKDWRRALAAWKEERLHNKHNRATLHRALYYSGRSERPEAHLRESLRLYSSLNKNQEIYQSIRRQLLGHLQDSIEASYRSGNVDSCVKSLGVLAGAHSLEAAEKLQNKMFGPDLRELSVQAALFNKNLLVYQGVAHAPPEELLEESEQTLEETIIPMAVKLSHAMLEGSELRHRVERTVAEACVVLAESFVKNDEHRSAKKWRGEAARWEPSTLTEWTSLRTDEWGDEEAAEVHFPEKQQETFATPILWGNALLGRRSYPVKQVVGEAREEHLESFFFLSLPVFPLRRLVVYRNLENGVLGKYRCIALTTWDHIRQGITVLSMSFLLAVGVAVVTDRTGRAEQPVEQQSMSVQELEAEIDAVLDQLKALVREEAQLNNIELRSKKQDERLEEITRERQVLIGRLNELDRQRKR